MYKIIYMVADFEPWWQFDDWKKYIKYEHSCDSLADAKAKLDEELAKFQGHYEHEECREEKYWAFWSDNEKVYCEACEDDAQVYHGIVFLQS